MSETTEGENADADLFVIDAEGNRHKYGKNNHRTKLYDKKGNQITKSCHVCQDQHVSFKCQASEHCLASYCVNCLTKYHETLTLRDAVEHCPRCRGVCSCRRCLRQTCRPNLVLDQDQKENVQLAEHILKCCGPFVHQLLQKYDKEAKKFGMKLEDVRIQKPDGDFVTCDRCSTSIPDLYLSCQQCNEGTDICIACIEEQRALGERAIEAVMRCQNCFSKLVLTRLMSTDMLKDLRKIAQKYKNSTNQGVTPVFFYPFTETADPKISLDFKFSSDDEDAAPKVQLLVERPPIMEQRHSDVATSDVIKKLEQQLSHVSVSTEWREAGNGNRVRVIDSATCSEEDMNKLLQLCIWKGEPLVVRNIKGVMDWRPQTMSRVFADRRGTVGKSKKPTKKRGRKKFSDLSDSEDLSDEEKLPEFIDPNDVCVILCAKKGKMEYWKQSAFFSVYEKGTDNQMYKIKDWPPDVSFQAKLMRHYQDFVEMLPFAQYTNPVSGMLNLTTALPQYCCRPDLGPKSYLATGRMTERNDGTDSVTKLHLDMTDAINILVHAQRKNPGDEQRPGAVWTVISRRDVAIVTDYLRNPDAICEKTSYLTKQDREKLVEEHGVRMWTFEQFENDAVYVPSGCPHQVRNTRSCLKVAVDFFPPESAAIVMGLTNYRRQFARRVKNDEEKDVGDTLQGQATILYACHHAYKITTGRKKTFPVVTEEQKRKSRRTEIHDGSKKTETHDGFDADKMEID